MTPTRPPRLLTSRFGIIVAVTIGFGVGAAGFAAAQHDDPAPAASPTTVATGPSTTVDDSPSTSLDDGPSVTAASGPTITVDDNPSTTVDDSPSTSVDDSPSVTAASGPTITVDDSPSRSVDDSPSVTVNTVPSTSVDDSPSVTVNTVPSTSVDDSPSTSVAASLPAPFTTTYSSSGGSINVTWSGTAFTLNSVSPAPGFRAEIEDQAWDRVRVDFESDGAEARIEVRINDGSLRVRVD